MDFVPAEKPAILGGAPVKSDGWPQWPVGRKAAKKRIQEILDSRRWSRHSGKYVTEFENALANRIGVKYALTVCGGAAALDCMMHGVEIEPGDEVLVTPLTFPSGAAAPLLCYALPIFVDVDDESFQMDPDKIEERITPQTRAILVCHWGGQAADLDRIMDIARRHDLAVCEDSYEAVFAQWRGKQLGTIGDVGVLGHHQSEVLPCGEGATLIGNDEAIMSRCYAWSDFGREVDWETHKPRTGTWPHLGRNMKVTEMQGALLLEGLQHVNELTQKRVDNAAYLKQLIRNIPGIEPQKEYDGQTRGAYLQFMMRYERRQFSDLALDRFVEAVGEEGILLSRGMTRPLTREPYIDRVFQSRHINSVFSKQRLDRMRDSLACPVADQVTAEVNFCIHGAQMQSSRSDMEAIAAAIQRVHKYSAEIKRL